MHRVWTSEVGFNFGDDSMLRMGQFIRQVLIEACNKLSIDFVLNSDGVTFDQTLTHYQDQLHAEQLIKCQTSARHFFLGKSLRDMDAEQGVLTIH